MESPIATQLTCTQCGGELHPDEGQIFVTCPYCAATVYLDKSRVVFHWYVAPTLDEQQAMGALFRWMSGSTTVKDLDRKAKVTGQAFQYFPLWYFRSRSGKQEETNLRPAAATSITELSRLPLPAGDLRRYESSLDSRSAAPTVPLEAALEWLGPGAAGVQEMALVHVPVYFYQYTFKGQTYSAVVDAASGVVLANLYPAKAEAPYVAVGLVTALVYMCLALAPIIGFFSDEGAGLGIGLAVFVIAGLIAAPFLFAWAYMVASKV